MLKKFLTDISRFILYPLTNQLIFKFYANKKFCKSKVKKIAKNRLFWHFLEKYTKNHVKIYHKNPSKFRCIFTRFTSKSLINTKIFRSQNFESMDPPLIGFCENRLFQKFNFFVIDLHTEKFFDFSKYFQKSQKIKKIFSKSDQFVKIFGFIADLLRTNSPNFLIFFFKTGPAHKIFFFFFWSLWANLE